MATTGAAQNDQVCLLRWVDDRWQRDGVCPTADVLAVSEESRMPGSGPLLADAAASYFIAIDAAAVDAAPTFFISRVRYAGTVPDERQVRDWCRTTQLNEQVECAIANSSVGCAVLLPASARVGSAPGGGDHARVYVASSPATQVLRPVGTRAQFERVVRAQGIADPASAIARGAALFCHLADYWLTPTTLFERWLAVTGLSVPTEATPVTEVLETIVTLGQELEGDNRLTLIQYDKYMGITRWKESTPEARRHAEAAIKRNVAANRALGDDLVAARRRLDEIQAYYPELAAFLPLFETAFPAIDGQAISRGWTHIQSP